MNMIIVMGVSGCGKSTVGELLSKALSVDFLDGDSLHSDSNIKKMAGGIPLNDEDRIPWLQKIRSDGITRIQDASQGGRRKSLVVVCSALKLKYRDILRGEEDDSELKTYFIYLKGSPHLLLNRMKARKSHFMKSDMLNSQLATLEEPSSVESRVGIVQLGVGDEERGIDAVMEDVIKISKSWFP